MSVHPTTINRAIHAIHSIQQSIFKMNSWPGLDEARTRLLSLIPAEFGEYVVYEEPPPTDFERLREILEEYVTCLLPVAWLVIF